MEDRVSTLLLEWYSSSARDLPWRIPPESGRVADPYRVWLSEVMLQQTTVAAVKPYFAIFTERWPTVEALAAAADADVMAAWAGLGYYSRARNLIACARAVVAMGGFPQDENALRNLPGLGAYTAAAVAAIAFGQRAVVVDANVERVMARLFAIEEPMPKARTEIRLRADAVTPALRSGDFAQAMMDLGSSICTARDPKCLLCPLNSLCMGLAAGDPSRLPVKAPRKAKPTRSGTAFWIERDGHVWLVKRPGKGMLGGMRALPDDGWNARNDGDGGAPLRGAWEAGGLVRHSFSHFHLEMGVARYASDRFSELGSAEGEWWPVASLDEAGLPTVFAKAAQLILARA